LNNLPLILRAKLAWARDWVSNPSLNSSFESLPGTSFTVNGAPIPHDSALTSVGAQLFFTPNWSFLAKFDAHRQTYALQQPRAIAVGTLIAERPPRRTVRAAFPHTAPTLGNDGSTTRMQSNDWYTYPPALGPTRV